MFHCAAGKDRTGVLSALLLDVLGVRREGIAEDYAMSAAGIERVLARLAAQPPYQRILADCTLEEHIPNPQVMLDFLGRLDTAYGRATGWLCRHGVEAERLDRFRSAMVDDALQYPTAARR
jgi:protein-tyrosine phosphatase